MDIDVVGIPISLEEYEDDVGLISLANKNRLLLPSSPRQSFFRVYALIIIKTIKEEYLVIHGTNSEADYIGSSICAERSGKEITYHHHHHHHHHYYYYYLHHESPIYLLRYS
jgi:hypothetical protein